MLSINISELVLTIISFFLLLFSLNRFLYTPVLKFMRERQARLDAQMKAESDAQNELSQLNASIDAAKAATREQAKAQLAAQRAQELEAQEEYAKKLHSESAARRRDAKARVQTEGENALARAAEEQNALARALADKLRGE